LDLEIEIYLELGALDLRFFKFISISLFFVALSGVALAYTNPGSPTGFVNDFAGVFSGEQKATLEQKLVTFEKETSNEITVVTIKALDGDTIENFAVKLFEDWEIGKKDKDNGVLVLLAMDDRQMRIEVGYGLEGALTDAQSFWIINKIMKPAFQQENDIEVLFDDRDASAGEKFADADLIGLPYRLVVSEKTLKEKSVELKKRSEEKIEMIKISEIGKYFSA